MGIILGDDIGYRDYTTGIKVRTAGSCCLMAK